MSDQGSAVDTAVRDDIFEIPLQRLDGTPTSLSAFRGQLLLLVNVASKCGLTPQYEGLQRLHETYGARGLAVLGFPCNQFGEQEPGGPEEIAGFCSLNYGVTFPLFSKLVVNGPSRHPLYAILCESADAEGRSGDIVWNFEKFLVSGGGEVVARFHPTVGPEAPALVTAIEANLPAY